MQLIRLTFAIIFLILHCSAGPIAQFLPETRDLGLGDASAQISQSSLLVAHHLQGTVSSNTDDLLTVIPVTPSVTNSPLLPVTNSAGPAHSTVQPSNEQSFSSSRVPSHTAITQLSTTSTVSGYAHQSQGTASTSPSVLSPIRQVLTSSQSSLTIYGPTIITSSEHHSSQSLSHTDPQVSSGPGPTVHTLASTHSLDKSTTGPPSTSSSPQISGHIPSRSSPAVHSPATHSGDANGSPSTLLSSLNTARSLSVSTRLSGSFGTTRPFKQTNIVPSLSPALSGSSTHRAHSLLTGSVTIPTIDHSPKTSAPTAVSTSLTVGVVGTLPVAVSSTSASAPSGPYLEATNDVNSHPVTVGTIITIGNTSGSLPTSASPAPGDTKRHSGSSPPHAHETTTATTAKELPTRSTTFHSAQKTALSLTSGGGPQDDKPTGVPEPTTSTVSDPVIVVVTPGQSTSWTNTWVHISDSTSASSQSSSTTTTVRPHGTIAKPKIPTGPTRHHSAMVPEQTASHTHNGISKGVELVTTIKATSTVMQVVTVAGPNESTEIEDAKATRGPNDTATLNQQEEASDTPVPQSQKIKPTVETGGPAPITTEPEVEPSSPQTGAIDDILRGLQVVPLTPQGFVTVTETKTETTTHMKTTTETETKTLTVYINPTMS